MNNIIAGHRGFCNYCLCDYSDKKSDGITWQRENGKWFHACDMCAAVFLRRINGAYYSKIKINWSIPADEEVRCYLRYNYNKGLIDESMRDRVGRCKDVNIEKSLVREFTEEEERFIADYSATMSMYKNESKKAKAAYTFARKRLNEQWFVDSLVQNGSVSTVYFGTIETDKLESLGKWSVEELNIIKDIKQKREEEIQFAKEHPEEYKKILEERKAQRQKEWEERMNMGDQ